MDKDLSREDIDEKIRHHVYAQDYSSQELIQDVKIIPLNTFVSEEGDFGELIRINKEGYIDAIPNFHVAQINRTRLIPSSIKAWHLHYKQNEIWYLPPAYNLMVGLWDIRKDSPTNGLTMRIPMGGGKSQLLLIPNGVAHGSANFSSNTIELFYFVNQQFNIDDPDEKRIPWDSMGPEFWTPQRD